MEWTLTNLVIQIVAGFLGAHGAASATHEHRFGLLGHSLVGLICGALSGYFFQTTLLTVVTGSGSVMTPRVADIVVTQALAGVVVGAIGMFAVGFALQQGPPKGGNIKRASCARKLRRYVETRRILSFKDYPPADSCSHLTKD